MRYIFVINRTEPFCTYNFMLEPLEIERSKQSVRSATLFLWIWPEHVKICAECKGEWRKDFVSY